MLSLTKTVPFVQRSTQKQYFAFANQTKFQSKQNIRTHINEITNVIRIAYNPRVIQFFFLINQTADPTTPYGYHKRAIHGKTSEI